MPWKYSLDDTRREVELRSTPITSPPQISRQDGDIQNAFDNWPIFEIQLNIKGAYASSEFGGSSRRRIERR